MGQNMGQSLTHVLTHNRIAYNGQVSIFQNTMSAKLKKPRNFQNFLKRKSYDLLDFHSMFKPLPMPITGTGRGFLVYFILLAPARWQYVVLHGGGQLFSKLRQNNT